MADVKSCSTCHEIRPLTDCNMRRSAFDGRQARCRSCSRVWYVENRVQHKVNTKARSVRVRLEYRQRLLAHLREHPCVDCGEDDVRVQEFDHEPAHVKLADVSMLISDAGAWRVIEAEMAKCSVRCASCHRRVTVERAGSWRQLAWSTDAVNAHERALTRLQAVFD